MTISCYSLRWWGGCLDTSAEAARRQFFRSEPPWWLQGGEVSVYMGTFMGTQLTTFMFRGLWPICSSLRTHQFSCFWGPMVYPNIIWSNQKILTCLPFPNHFFPESMSSWEGFVQICWKKGVGTIYPTFEMVYPCLLCLFFNGNWPSSYNPRSIPRSLGFWDDFVGSTGPKRSEP